MIYFNGIELDYNENTLNKIVVKKALSDIESLADRKGTSSTTFDVPRTAHNEKAFVNMTVEGSEFTSVGTGSIFLEGNEYARGKIYVRGYNDTVFQLLFLGNDTDFVKSLNDLPMNKLINENASDSFANAYMYYTDVAFIYNTEHIYLGQIDYILSQPSPLISSSTDYLRANVLAPHFFVKSIITNIVEKQGYLLSSDFFESDYGKNIVYSNYSGDHKPINYFGDSSTTGTSLAYTLFSGAIVLGSMTGGGLRYTLDRPCASLNFRFNLNLTNDSKIHFTDLRLVTFDSSNVIIDISNRIRLKEGENDIDLSITTANVSSTYFQLRIDNTLKTGESLPITQTITLKNTSIRYDELIDGDILPLKDYLGDKTQVEFLKGILTQFNLNMLIEGDNVVIELADISVAPTDFTSLNSIITNTTDITNKIESNVDVSISVKPSKNVYMEQPYEGGTDIIEVGDNVTAFASYDYSLNTFGVETDNIKSEFKTMYDKFSDYIFISGVSQYLKGNASVDSWENYLSCWWVDYKFGINLAPAYRSFFHNAQTFENIDGTLNNAGTGGLGIVFPVMSNGVCRFSSLGETLFTKTLEQKKNNKVREIELYDYTGNLITFRSDYIIDNQIYKLLSYEFEPISKKVKAKIILK